MLGFSSPETLFVGGGGGHISTALKSGCVGQVAVGEGAVTARTRTTKFDWGLGRKSRRY